MTKRYRCPKAKPYELKAQWGKLPHESNPDLIYVSGDGIERCDRSYLHHILTNKIFNTLTNDWENSFIDELEKRGYDISTIKFSIKKNQQ